MSLIKNFRNFILRSWLVTITLLCMVILTLTANAVSAEYEQYERAVSAKNSLDLASVRVFLPMIFKPPLLPGAFEKISPANNSISEANDVHLTWTASKNATKYEYCLDTTNDNNCSNWISVNNRTYAAVSGLSSSTKYFWQVRAWTNAAGPVYANGAANSYRNFTTLKTGVFVKNTCTLYVETSGYYRQLTCEFYNNTSEPIEGANLEIEVYDTNGNLVESATRYANIRIIHPQETSCVIYYFKAEPDFDHVKISGGYYTTEEFRPPVTVVNVQGGPGPRYYNLNGTVQNENSKGISQVYVVSTFYSNAGKALHCSSIDIDDATRILSPGEESTFGREYSFPDKNAILWYKVHVHGFWQNKLTQPLGPEMELIIEESEIRDSSPDRFRLPPNVD